MKVCPNCQQQYADDDLNFCLNDGGILTREIDDAAPTVMLNQARTTNQNWSNVNNDPFTPWQNQPLQQQQQNQAFYKPQWTQGNDQTLPTLSLIFGILSMLMVCCYGGFYFGVAALIIGYIGWNNSVKDPEKYGGQGLALAGLILGAISFFGTLLIVIFAILGNIS